MKNRDNSGKPSLEDQKIWENVTRSVTAYSTKKEKTAPPRSARHTPKPKPAPPTRREDPVSPKPFLFDPATAKALKRGKMRVEARLDLHGLSQEKALSRLESFISDAVAAQKRTLLVITGKGRLSSSGGILRRMLPLWLEKPFLKKYVLAFSEARPEHGGSGAFYIRLRKSGS